MKDPIERQDAIDALYELYEYMRMIDPTEAADLVRQGVFLAEKKIENMPSAQPDSKETSSTHKALDTISRQAAIKAFKDFLTIHDSRGVEYLCSAVTMDGVNKILSDLPSAQPEIVRCKDCLMHGVCRFEQGLGLDGYCSQAKRRTDD